MAAADLGALRAAEPPEDGIQPALVFDGVDWVEPR
jgi:hypothetical protein